MTHRSCLVVAVAVTAAVALTGGCRSGLGGGGDDWSRSYVQPEERVWQALLATLNEEGFVVDEVDREGGRVLATGGDSRMWREALLEVSLRTTGEVVRVVFSGRLGTDPGADMRRLDELIRTILNSLDEHLLGHPRSAMQ